MVKVNFCVLKGLNDQQDTEEFLGVPSDKLLATRQAEQEKTGPQAVVTSMSR